MFVGAIPRSAQAVVLEAVRSWPSETPVQVICSGNLTIERTVAPLARKVFGCDVTLYSCALGCAAARRPIAVRVSDAHLEHFGWLDASLPRDDPVACAATVELASRFAPAINKVDHPHWRRIVQANREQWERLHAETTERLRASLPELAGFHVGGAMELLESIPRETAVIGFPPFTKGWGYEALFKKLHALFEWEKPEYRLLDEEGLEALIDRIADRPSYLVGLPHRCERLEADAVALTFTTLRGVPLNFYGRSGSKRVVMPRQKVDSLPIRRLEVGRAIEGPLRVLPIRPSQFNSLRAQYLDPKITPAQASHPFAVVCGDRLVGAMAFSPANPQTADATAAKIGPFVYMLSDFAVAPTDYPRLSKLMLYAARSSEVRSWLEQRLQQRVQSILTTAFSDNPVSMKYRGVFDLLARKEGREGHAFMLNYSAPAGSWTLDEGFSQWTAKHARKGRSASASKHSTHAA
jgi:hypothetical protein